MTATGGWFKYCTWTVTVLGAEFRLPPEPAVGVSLTTSRKVIVLTGRADIRRLNFG